MQRMSGRSRIVLITDDAPPFRKGDAVTLLRHNDDKLDLFDLVKKVRGTVPQRCATLVPMADLVSADAKFDFDIRESNPSADAQRFLKCKKNDVMLIFNRTGAQRGAAGAAGFQRLFSFFVFRFFV